MSLSDTVQAPVTQGQQLGTIKYYMEGTELGSVSLVADSSVTKSSFFNIIKNVVNNWFNLLRK